MMFTILRIQTGSKVIPSFIVKIHKCHVIITIAIMMTIRMIQKMMTLIMMMMMMVNLEADLERVKTSEST